MTNSRGTLALVAIAAGTAGIALGLMLPVDRAMPRGHSTAPVTASGPEREAHALDGPFARAYRAETGANRWLLLLSASEHATAEDMSTLLRIVGNDPAAVRLLGARWAELDPKGMFGSLYADWLLPENAKDTLPERSALARVLVEHWAREDLPAVIKALDEVPEFSGLRDFRMMLIGPAMKQDVPGTLEAMERWQIRHYSPDMAALRDWAAANPRQAAERMLESKLGYGASSALQEIAAIWGASDPKAALQFASAHAGSQRARFGSEVVRAWAAKQPKAAAEYVASLPEFSARAALAPGLMKAWGESDPAAAMSWCEANLRGSARADSIAAVIKTVATKSLQDASQIVAEMPAGEAQNKACASIFETWFGRGGSARAEALEWVTSLPDPDARAAAIERVQWDWLWRDPDGAKDFVSGPSGDSSPSSLVSQVAQNQANRDPEAAMDWANSLPADRAALARGAVLESWLQTRPEGAMEYALTLSAGTERESAIRSITRTVLWQHPDRFERWFESLSEAERATARSIAKSASLTGDARAKIDKVLAAP